MIEKLPIKGLALHPLRVFKWLGMVTYWATSYFSVQEATDFTKAEVVESKVDERIPIKNNAVYPYVTEYLFLAIVALYLIQDLDRKSFNKTYKAFKYMVEESVSVFRRMPTRMRDRDRVHHPFLRYIQILDGPTNCFPSLHCALVTLSYQIIKDSGKTDELVKKASRQVSIDISRCTMETKQHSIIDVISGVELGRRNYLKFFPEGKYDDFLDVIIPELTDNEWKQIHAILDKEPDFITMKEELMALVKDWSSEKPAS